jgi:hypothetical protein
MRCPDLPDDVMESVEALAVVISSGNVFAYPWVGMLRPCKSTSMGVTLSKAELEILIKPKQTTRHSGKLKWSTGDGDCVAETNWWT